MDKSKERIKTAVKKSPVKKKKPLPNGRNNLEILVRKRMKKRKRFKDNHPEPLLKRRRQARRKKMKTSMPAIRKAYTHGQRSRITPRLT